MDTVTNRGAAHPAMNRPGLLIIAVVLMLAGLPLAAWLDMRSLSETILSTQAGDLNALISSFRDYYASHVVDRVQSISGSVQVAHNYEAIPGAIPIPATLSLELGKVISDKQANIGYRFVSDYPFKSRAPHMMDDFERGALATLRANPDQKLSDISWDGLSSKVRLVSPILMSASCVECHNTDPDSPKTDWKVGDVRGIQEIIITQPIARNALSFKYLVLYFLLAAASGVSVIVLQRRQTALVRAMNDRLESANDFLAGISEKISRYLSPQIFKSIFSGQKDVTIATERKKLSIFFSDIKDFTSTSERLQPEEMTALLNEYFTEMAAIALRHGGTIDKFIGDAILVFFGDPETKGVAEDALACLRMAAEMQHRMAELAILWRNRGIEKPLQIRCGINTGFCNVGNFGSSDRMDYTIIGAEANLAARLQSVAEPGQVVVSYETYALVKDHVAAHALPAISMKGIGRAVVPYAIDGLTDAAGRTAQVFSEQSTGVDLFLDINMVDADAAKRVKAILQSALNALENRQSQS